jgi:TATA-box binding protein (TBP) (component of TFIID and TFIIIB)
MSSVSQFSFIIRKRLEMSKESALFLLVAGKHSITGDSSMGEVYEKYKMIIQNIIGNVKEEQLKYDAEFQFFHNLMTNNIRMCWPHTLEYK